MVEFLVVRDFRESLLLPALGFSVAVEVADDQLRGLEHLAHPLDRTALCQIGGVYLLLESHDEFREELQQHLLVPVK